MFFEFQFAGDGDTLTVFWKVSHEGANEIHFGLSESPANDTEPGQRHTLDYHSQNFYELLLYPAGDVQLRRPGPGLSRWNAVARGQVPEGFDYHLPNQVHRFWTRFDSQTGMYEFGTGIDPRNMSSTVLRFGDPDPVAVAFVSVNVYCCSNDTCSSRSDANGYFCFCDSDSAPTPTHDLACRGQPIDTMHMTTAPPPPPSWNPTGDPNCDPR